MKSLATITCLYLLVVLNQRVSAMNGIVEIRTYTLKAGNRERFHEIVRKEVMPLLQKWRMSVVSYGPSLHDENTYYLIRSFKDVEERLRIEDAFYNSSDWREGPRELILSMIETYSTLVTPKDATSLDSDATVRDVELLSVLNAQFIRNFVTQDTIAHNEIIHKDFVCIDNDGLILSRVAYMRDWAQSYQNGNFKTFGYKDQFIRVFGEVALVRSRTEYTRTINGKEVLGVSVYTDTYLKENGRWWCIQAQITPIK